MFFNVLKFIQLLIIIFTFVILPMESMSSDSKDELVEAILSGDKSLPKEVKGLSIGQFVSIPDWQWVYVVKDMVEDITDEEDEKYRDHLSKGGSCGIERGRQLEILGFSNDSKLALVKNNIGKWPGTSCPPGAIFFLAVDELREFDERYEMFLEKERLRDKMVQTILLRDEDLPKEVEGLSIGQIVNIPEWQWVDVVKRVIDETDKDYLEKGDSCGIQRGEQLEILGFSNDAKLALVENDTRDSGGTPCPTGAIFFLAVDELKEFDERYEMFLELERFRDNLVETILSGDEALPKEVEGLYVGQVVNIPDWRWVGVVKDIKYVEKGDVCGIKEGWTLKILGFSDDAQLALVTNEVGKISGTPCPPGAVFFLLVNELKEFDKLYGAVLEKKQSRDELVEAILSEDADLPKEVEGLFIGQVVNVFNHRWVNTVGQLNTVRQFDNPVGLFIKRVVDPVVEVTPAIDSFLISVGLLDKYTITDDSCSIDDGEQLEVLGFSSDKMYVLVKNIIGNRGAPCPAGAIFFLPVDTLLNFEEK